MNSFPSAGARTWGHPSLLFIIPPPHRWAGPLVSSVYLWDQPEEGSLGTGTLLSLEEQILNSTFEACDPQRTGQRIKEL